MMRKWLVLTLVLVMVLSVLAGCSSPAPAAPAEGDAPADAVRIGFVTTNMNDTFQTYVFDAAAARAAELGYQIDIQDAQEDVVRQQDQVNAMIQQEVDALIVVPVDTSAMEPITEAAKEAGIPLVYVNRNPFGESDPPENVYYVGSQEIVAGRFQGQYLVDVMPEGGGVVILMGILSNEGAVKRTEGNEEVLNQYPEFSILAKESGNWQYDQGMTLAENWITAYGDDLNAILANNDGMAIGALQAVEAAGRQDILVLGVDAIPDAVDLVEEGKLAATVLQDAAGQGAGGVDFVAQILAGETPEPVKWIDFVLVTPENVDQFK